MKNNTAFIIATLIVAVVFICCFRLVSNFANARATTAALKEQVQQQRELIQQTNRRLARLHAEFRRGQAPSDLVEFCIIAEGDEAKYFEPKNTEPKNTEN